MSGLHNLKLERVVKRFERAGWANEGQRGSHVKLTKEGNKESQIVKCKLQNRIDALVKSPKSPFDKLRANGFWLKS